jgi:hypothetical protein
MELICRCWMYHCERHVLVEIYRFIRETNSKRQLENMILILLSLILLMQIYKTDP